MLNRKQIIKWIENLDYDRDIDIIVLLEILHDINLSTIEDKKSMYHELSARVLSLSKR